MAYILKTTGEMVPLPALGELIAEERRRALVRTVGGLYDELVLPGGEEIMLLSCAGKQEKLTVNHPATAVAYQVLTPGTFVRGDVVICLRNELVGDSTEKDPNRDVLELLPEPVTFHPPFYLVKGVVTCQGCGTDFLAAAVLATAADNGEEAVGPAYFCNVPELPAAFRLEVQWHAPLYRKVPSGSETTSYFANVCPDCGSVVSDQVLFLKDGPFAGHNQNRASVKLLLYEEPLTIRASLEKREGPL